MHIKFWVCPMLKEKNQHEHYNVAYFSIFFSSPQIKPTVHVNGKHDQGVRTLRI